MTRESDKYGNQITKDEAIAIAESGISEDWSFEERARFGLFQKRLAMPFNKLHEAVEKTLDRPVFTHEFADRDRLIKEFLGAKKPPTFDEIINMIPEEKRIIVNYE